uniref:uncharacterized protein LOC122588295 n=1 Tax=Erigeron canadensis TaxID=72917 RepID=UPI001CB9A7ED|nr:uncharacterized protein LOC122588295 [Erigeron canadensis]
MAEDSHSFTKTPFQDLNQTSSLPTKPPKSKLLFIHYFISKSLITILVILVFLYFPSQVPDYFKNTTIVTKIWDLIYLLVIGIAVCYGLFSRKIDTSDHSCDDDDNVKETYLSEISHISSIFENGVQGFNEFGEKDLFEEFKGLGSRFNGFGNGKPKLVKENKGLFLPVRNLGTNSVGKPLGKDSSNDEIDVEKLGKPDTIGESKPLCLPVKNLGSKSLDSASGKSGVKDWFSDWDDTKNGKFRGLVPIKLEEKFKENDSDSDSNDNSDSAPRTPLNWRSKSMRLEKRVDVSTLETKETSNIRPFSADVDLKDLKSQSTRYSMPPHMKKIFYKEESKGMEPNLNVGASFMETKPRVTSLGSSSEMNNCSSSKEILKDLEKIKVDDGSLDLNKNAPFIKSKSQRSSLGVTSENVLETKEKPDSSNVIKKPATVANTYKRGKSVRTNRPKEQVIEAVDKNFPVQTDDKVETRSKRETNAINVVAEDLSDTEPYSGEVDRKAEEFIAKFKEQIRLQKVASMRKLYL